MSHIQKEGNQRMIKTPGYRLLVKPDEIKKQTASGIIIEYGENEKLEKGARVTGTVVDIGWQCWGIHKGEQPWCKLGDKIFWAKYAGKQVIDPYTNEEFLILNDEDVCGVVYENGTYTDSMEALSQEH